MLHAKRAGEDLEYFPVQILEWACTTPLIVLQMGALADAETRPVLRAATMDFLSIVAGGVALITPSPLRWVLFVFALLLGLGWIAVSLKGTWPQIESCSC